MDYILPIFVFVLCMISFVVYLRDIKEHPVCTDPEDGTSLVPKSAIVYGVIMVCVTMGAAVLFCMLYADNGILTNMKRMALLSVLWPVAYIDFRTYRIPNAFIVLGLAYRLVLIPFELFMESDLILTHLLSEVIAAAALLLASLLCSLCIKNSIGFGDIKLFVVMGLLLSLDGIWGAIFLSLIISFFVSAYLLIAKKKTRKDKIPFGPALVLGTFLSVCLSGM